VKDNVYLHDEVFKQLSALAIAEGICDFWGVTCTDLDDDVSILIEQPALTPTYGSGVCDSGWYRYTNPRGQYAYLALNATEEAQSKNIAAWEPTLPVSGEYNVEVYIPAHNAVTWTCPGVTTATDSHHVTYSLTHANGISELTVNQEVYEDEWVSLGIFHFNSDTDASLKLSDVTGEANHTTSVSASAVRFTLVGNAGVQFYNTAWAEEDWLREETDATVEEIRLFFEFYGSCLADPIYVGDNWVDIPQLLYNAIDQQTQNARPISPKILLALMEAEQAALSTCPDATALANLMGLEPASSAQQQIEDAAALLGNSLYAFDLNGITANGWQTGVAKLTSDGVTVTPANDTITILFDVLENAGTFWGGDLPDESGVQGIYRAYMDFNLFTSLPEGIFTQYFPLSYAGR
jgi:hypothetical protein